MRKTKQYQAAHPHPYDTDTPSPSCALVEGRLPTRKFFFDFPHDTTRLRTKAQMLRLPSPCDCYNISRTYLDKLKIRHFLAVLRRFLLQSGKLLTSANKMRLKRKNGVSLRHPTLQPLFKNEQINCQFIYLLSAQCNRHRFSLLGMV